MREIMLAMLALVVISVGSSYALQEIGFSSADRTSGNAVRLGDD